jgi:hypothetical protein
LEGIRLTNEMKIIPNETDLLIKIQNELRFDSLFNLIMDREQLKRELFHPEFISALEYDIHRWYSVAEAGRVLGGKKPIPPSSLTYYVDNLEEYIIPEGAPSNKYIRLNYLSLVKIKMVLLLKDEFRLNGIKAEVGLTGNPKHVITPKGSKNLRVGDKDEFEDLKETVDRLEAMNEMLFGLLVEKGEDDKLQLKQRLQLLLSSDIPLLEGPNSIVQRLEVQDELVKNLIEENKELKERIQKAEEQTTTLDKKLEDKANDREKIIESEKHLNTLTKTLRARQQAEAEFDNQGLFKRLSGNRAEYVAKRIKEILSSGAE